jgi:hypothetical protein
VIRSRTSASESPSGAWAGTAQLTGGAGLLEWAGGAEWMANDVEVGIFPTPPKTIPTTGGKRTIHASTACGCGAATGAPSGRFVLFEQWPMSRSVEITVPSDRTDRLVQEIRQLDEVIGLRVQRGISVDPPGDVISLSLTNKSLRKLIRILDSWGVAKDEGGSIAISEPTGVISYSYQDEIEKDESDVIWEEMEFSILRESNMDLNGIFVMFTSGVLAAVGVATGAVHLVIGGMVIAPGFKPITRVALGLVAGGSESWHRGLIDTLKAYSALFVGAMFAALVLRLSGRPPLTGSEAYLPSEALVQFWIEISLPALLTAAVGGAAGAVLIAVNRSVLTAGVMIALALIPPPAIAALALVAGEPGLAGRGVLRWAIEVAVVTTTGLLVYLWKRTLVQRRAIVS